MIPARFAPILFGLILSFLMSGIVSSISTFRALEGDMSFFALWPTSWMYGWAVSFPTVLVVGPIARRIVTRLVREA